ncbi:MAG: hypothetical protein ACLPVF_10575 [Acidimicrobiales bacterium]
MASAVISLGLADLLSGAPAQAASPNVSTLLVRAGEMPGLSIAGSPASASNVTRFVHSVYGETGNQAKLEIMTLESEGFQAGAVESLKGSGSREGVSTVIVFGTPSDANQQLANENRQSQAHQAKGSIIHSLTTGIPGAEAFMAIISDAGAASNVFFTNGRCTCLVGDSFPGPHAETISAVVAAAKSIDRRVSGACNKARVSE